MRKKIISAFTSSVHPTLYDKNETVPSFNLNKTDAALKIGPTVCEFFNIIRKKVFFYTSLIKLDRTVSVIA